MEYILEVEFYDLCTGLFARLNLDIRALKSYS